MSHPKEAKLPSPGRIAVIDDDESARLSLVSLLRALGFEARGFPSASSYMAEAAEGWGCVISDIQMPDMDGFKLISAIGRQPRATPVILTTAYSIPNVRRSAMDAGAVWFVEKPIDEDALLSRLTDILSRNS